MNVKQWYSSGKNDRNLWLYGTENLNIGRTGKTTLTIKANNEETGIKKKSTQRKFGDIFTTKKP